MKGLRVERVSVVAAFHADANAALKVGTALSAIADSEGGQVAQIPVPANAPAHFPRVMLGTDQQVVNVCLDRVQVSISPPSQVAGSLEESFEFAARTVQRLLTPLLSFEWMKNQWCGSIVEMSLPVNTLELGDASKVAAQLMTQIDWAGDDLKSFDLQIGRQKGLFYNTFRVSTYETRTAELAVSPGGTVSLKAFHEQSEVQEVGLSFSIDINNRPDSSRMLNVEEIARVMLEARKEIDAAITGLMRKESVL